jgi:hypothetical protein
MIECPSRARFDRLWRTIAFALALLLPQAPAQAQESVFDVDKVAVDVTAETAAAARERAIVDGQTKAFRALMERLVSSENLSRLPPARPAEVTPLVRDFSVSDEKTSAVRYLANLTVRFRPEDVRRYLVDLGIPYAETRSKPVVVLPVYENSGTMLLWDDPNPWRQGWAARPPGPSGLVPMVLPSGDLTDIATIGVEQALRSDTQRLSAIANRYGAEDTIVAQATFGVSTRTGRPEVAVQVVRHGPSTSINDVPFVSSYAATESETVEALLARAASDVARQIENAWKRNNLMQFGRDAVAAVTVPVRGLADWIETQKRLASVPVVRRVELVLMSREEVRVNLHFIGEDEQLVNALRQADLELRARGGELSLGLIGGSQRQADTQRR